MTVTGKQTIDSCIFLPHTSAYLLISPVLCFSRIPLPIHMQTSVRAKALQAGPTYGQAGGMESAASNKHCHIDIS